MNTLLVVLLAIAAAGIVLALVLERQPSPPKPPKRDEVAHLEGGRTRS